MSANIFETIVANQILKVPSWARIITYFVCLIVIVYHYMFPQFIDGEVRNYGGESFDGSYIANRDASVGIKYNGRFFSTPTSDQGDWSLPLLSTAISGDVDLRIEYQTPSGETLFTSISVPRVMAVTENVLIGYNANTIQKFKLLNTISEETSRPNDNASVSEDYTLVDLAYADDKQEPRYEPIKKEVDHVINEKRTSEQSSSLSYSEKKVLQADIEKKYGINLNRTNIEQSKTAEDLSKIVVSKVFAKRGVDNYAYYGSFTSSGEWEERFFKVSGDNISRIPQEGDIVEATAAVNIRKGYIEYSLLHGWENKTIVGYIKPNERFLIEEVKRIASDYIWVKLHKIE